MANLSAIFEREAVKKVPTAFESKVQEALFSLRGEFQRGSLSLVPGDDLKPQYKINTADPKDKDPLKDLETMKQIRFLSIEKDGVSHDFPVRFEHATGLSAFTSKLTGKEHPVIVVTGLDGQEHSFQAKSKKIESYDLYNPLPVTSYHDSTGKIADFLIKELEKKALSQTPKQKLQTPSM